MAGGGGPRAPQHQRKAAPRRPKSLQRTALPQKAADSGSQVCTLRSRPVARKEARQRRALRVWDRGRIPAGSGGLSRQLVREDRCVARRWRELSPNRRRNQINSELLQLVPTSQLFETTRRGGARTPRRTARATESQGRAPSASRV